MADTKITALTALTAADPANDVIPIVDVSDTSMAASGTTKKISVNNILGASGTATLASATITGALGAAGLNVTAATIPANGVYLGSANNLSFSYASTLGMTLNSTGLGVGGSVLAKISAYLTSTATYNSAAAGDDTDFQISRVNNSTVSGQSSTIALNTSSDNGASTARVYLACVQESNASYASSFTVKTRNSAGTSAERFRIDAAGNCGMGVAPSAWTSAFGSVLQFKSAASSAGGSLTGSSADNFRMFANTYYDGAYKYIAAGFATQYEQSAGSHVWYLSGTTAGAIDGAITFSTALSLDKTGSLVLGSTAVATTATDGFLYIPSCAGAPTGVPTTKTGRVPMVVDSTNNRFYVYVSGTWKYTTLA